MNSKTIYKLEVHEFLQVHRPFSQGSWSATGRKYEVAPIFYERLQIKELKQKEGETKIERFAG